MPVVGQTPGVFVKAGSTAFVFPPECVVALANIGLEPGDFGTYKDVRARQSKARAKVKAAGASGGSGGEEIDGKPTDHDRFLASCTSGHLTPNATQQRQRNNACENATDGYSCAEAPCAPHYGSASEPGTEHYLITRLEEGKKPKAGSAPPGTAANQTYPPEARATHDAERGKIVQGAIAGNTQDSSQYLAAAKDGVPDQPKAEKTFQNMQEARAKSAAAIKADPAFQAAAAECTPEQLRTVAADKNGELAAACIEAFRQAAMREMKEKAGSDDAINAAKADVAEGNQPAKPGEAKTKKELANEQADAAEKREETARADKEKLKATHEKQEADRKAERTDTRKKEQEARAAERSDMEERHKEERKTAAAERKKELDAAPPEKKAELKAQHAEAAKADNARRDEENANLVDKHKTERNESATKGKQEKEDLRTKQAGERKDANGKVTAASEERESAQAKADRYNDAKCRVEQGERLKAAGPSADGPADGLTGGFEKKPGKKAGAANVTATGTESM